MVQVGNKLLGDWRSGLREDTRRKLEWIEANTKTSVAIRVDTFGQWMVWLKTARSFAESA